MIKAIETHYAGCRFRSRLEARWAVFFHHLGITWEYEAQGFEVEARLSGSWDHDDTINYLPDFWLPELELHVEVKGSLTADECVRLLDVAASLSEPGGGGCGNGLDTVVLGPVPTPRARRLPVRLHMHKGDLRATAWNPLDATQDVDLARETYTVAQDLGNASMFGDCDLPELWPWERTAESVGARLLTGFVVPGKPRRVTNAYTKARSARFEHGERG